MEWGGEFLYGLALGVSLLIPGYFRYTRRVSALKLTIKQAEAALELTRAQLRDVLMGQRLDRQVPATGPTLGIGLNQGADKGYE